MDDEALKELINEMFGPDEVRPGQMFGMPAFYAGKKMFACVCEGGIGLKLPEDRAESERERAEVGDFSPQGRNAGASWIRIEHRDPDGWMKEAELIRESADYARRLS